MKILSKNVIKECNYFILSLNIGFPSSSATTASNLFKFYFLRITFAFLDPDPQTHGVRIQSGSEQLFNYLM
jgi:hypothetical protein